MKYNFFEIKISFSIVSLGNVKKNVWNEKISRNGKNQ